MARRRVSVLGKFSLWAVVLAVITSTGAIAIYLVTQAAWLAVLLATIGATLLTLWSGPLLFSNTQKTLHTLRDGIQTLGDGDYTTGITRTSGDELGEIVQAFNELSSALRSERQNIYQRELLLDTVIQASPLALVLTNSRDTVVYGNLAARQLFSHGKPLEGATFESILATAPAPLRDAARSEVDLLFTLEAGDDTDTFHLSKRRFALNTQEHELYLLKQMTREINAQEAATWKKVMRVISHEINNSLAPISSLAHSGQALLTRDEPVQLQRVLETIHERAQHLQSFVEAYARFARLPKPNIVPVSWQDFFAALRRIVPFNLQGTLPAASGNFDTAQITQAMINIVKNALEAGSAAEDIGIALHQGASDVRIEVCDRGRGMPPAVLKSALLPFYSTKSTGTGLGLALCREIIEAHGGRISLANRRDGGAIICFWLPQREAGDGKF